MQRLIVGVVLSVASTGLEAQSVLLRLHPRVGDTLRTRLEQQTEVTATQPGAPARSVSTSVSIDSRTIVRATQGASTLVLTIVDHAHVSTTDAHASALVAEAERALVGQQLLLQLAADGTVERVRDGRGGAVSPQLAQSLGAMPAVFPGKVVAVGQSWTREMPLPAGGPMGAAGSSRVHATFRLDSLGRGGELAYVSMHGDIVPDGGMESAERGGAVSGSIAGGMQVDRARGWMTDSRVVVLIQSVMTPPEGSGAPVMRFLTRVTQRLRTMDKR